jgi:hypothetical protein
MDHNFKTLLSENTDKEFHPRKGRGCNDEDDDDAGCILEDGFAS